MEGQTTSTTPPGEGNEGTASAGGESLGWRAGLPAELRDHEWLKGFSKVGEFATAALELKGRADKAIVPPGEQATEEERTAYYKALGVPDTVDGYTFDSAQVPEGFKLTDEVTAWVKDFAHKNHLTGAQAQGLLVEMANRANGALRAQAQADQQEEAQEKAARNAALSNLRQTWKIPAGELNDQQMDQRLAAALDAGLKLFGPKFREDVEEADVGDNVYLIMALDMLRQAQLPDRITRGAQVAGSPNRHPGHLQYPWMRKQYGTPSDNE